MFKLEFSKIQESSKKKKQLNPPTLRKGKCKRLLTLSVPNSVDGLGNGLSTKPSVNNLF